ncbi:MAG: shikimate kinase [Candidatus Manganitrophus sp. SA1]|nr:shikimate kinase [Candidatus Manganitrophus morganii]
MKNIVLLGFMGTGKSAVGRRLATAFRYQFIDTDQEIEEKTHKRVADIFSEQGEEAFRRLESEAVIGLAERTGCVISTGGGIVLDSKNLDLLQKNGILVLLRCRPEVIFKRVQKRAGQRPLLQKADPLSEIKRLLAEREPFYRRADITLDTSDMNLDDVVQQIKRKVLEIEGRESTA